MTCRITGVLALGLALMLFPTIRVGAREDTAQARAAAPAPDTNIRVDVQANASGIEQNTRAIERYAEQLRSTNTRLEASLRDVRADLARIEAMQVEQTTRTAEEVSRAQRSLADSIVSIRRAVEEAGIAVAHNRSALTDVGALTGRNENFINRFWILVAAFLVLLMQAGFTAFEVGVVRSAHASAVGMKNLLDWLVVVVVYFVLGFGLMFGESIDGFLGTNLFMPTAGLLEGAKTEIGLGLEFFLFQMAFAATAATIVSGALAERTALVAYLMTAMFMSALVYPVFGHWAWGGAYLTGNAAWLYDLGFRDFAGSTVVHSVGAWVAWMGVARVGARHGRFRTDRPRRPMFRALLFGDPDHVNREDFQPNTLGFAVAGLFLLWFGWWGFNGGSLLRYETSISSILLNTNVAAAVGGLSGFFLAYYLDREDLHMKTLGGALGGLVAISACCNAVTVEAAIGIGMAASFVHHLGVNFLQWLGHDDPVNAIPVHGFCGILGTLCVALVADPQLSPGFLPPGGPIHSWLAGFGIESLTLARFVVQAIGIGVCFAFAGGLSWLFFRALAARRSPLEMRVADENEASGALA